jgi:broad specificity phosphatase PhoE
MENRAERKLILVRHSLPEIVPSLPASRWRLSDEGRRRCERLAERLAAYQPSIVVTSLEPKAIETGQIVARILGIPVETALDLHEHERPYVEPFGTREQFEARVSRLFEYPAELIFGAETADQAHNRFASAIDDVLATERYGNLAVVTHGTVLTLFVARAAGLAPVPFWKKLGLPAFVVLSLPDLSPQVVENVT